MLLITSVVYVAGAAKDSAVVSSRVKHLNVAKKASYACTGGNCQSRHPFVSCDVVSPS